MKKLLIVITTFMILIVGCTFKDEEDPLRYKGCVVIRKSALFNGNEVKLKLTHRLRKSFGCDYMWIAMPNWEFDRLNVGDTIK